MFLCLIYETEYLEVVHENTVLYSHHIRSHICRCTEIRVCRCRVCVVWIRTCMILQIEGYFICLEYWWIFYTMKIVYFLVYVPIKIYELCIHFYFYASKTENFICHFCFAVIEKNIIFWRYINLIQIHIYNVSIFILTEYIEIYNFVNK